MAIDLGTGASIAFGTSTFTANIVSMTVDGIERPAIDTSHLGTTTSRTFIPGDLVDEGSVTLEIQFDPSLAEPPKKGAAETVTISFALTGAGTTKATRAFTAFVTAFDFGVPLDELMTGSVTLKISGNVTVTAQS
jgi:hypothetical protein